VGAVPVREAASVVAAREGRRGPEILVVRRAAGSRFLPGYVAFPGGAVEPGDGDLAERWFGTPSEAVRACAVRELLEETGLALTRGGIRSVDGPSPMAAIEEAPPPLDHLVRLSRWIAPRWAPVRFDATFFGVRAQGGLEPRPARGEVAAAWWERAAVLLEDWRSGRIRLLWPTMKMLEGLAACRTVEEVLAARIVQEEPSRWEDTGMPRSTFLPEP
jgi:8-oxo-dGTP pyrophosphatase MutT (NUDIX family)